VSNLVLIEKIGGLHQSLNITTIRKLFTNGSGTSPYARGSVIFVEGTAVEPFVDFGLLEFLAATG
jgi:hypothetical protein